METQKQQCCVRECDSRDTHEHRGIGTDNLGRSITFIVQLCKPCKDALQSSRRHTTPSMKPAVSCLCANSTLNEDGVGNYPAYKTCMMKTLWIDPNDLADVWTVNNRKENTGHIESLAESMQQNGYLSEYPIIAFQAENIPIETDKPYLVACGHHRRKAAIAAEIDLIFAEVHDGTEEEWIEMMSLDNFQFDVASNPGIGLAFTEQERRAACFQLLLLPKYLRKTNVSLAGLWKVGEGTVRRWRQQVESLIGEGSPKLEKEYNVSPARIESLRSVIADPYRENEEGDTVAVRQKPKEATRRRTCRILVHYPEKWAVRPAIRRQPVPRSTRFQNGSFQRLYL